MKQFLAVFTGSGDNPKMKEWQALDPATRKAREESGKKEWMKWMEKNQKALAVQGGPLGKTKRVDAKGIADIRNQMSGFVVVHAESQEAAAQMFLKHPHFTAFPGDGVEIMEVMPIPM